MPAPSPSTLIDRVDETDTPVGTVSRSEVFAERAGFRVVHVFVFNQAGRLLIQRLGQNRERNALKWGSSVAAYLLSGENYLQGAERRLREELGLEGRRPAKFGSVVMPDQGARKFITLYLASAEQHEVHRADPDHIQQLLFWPIANI
ncbi:MAG: NUDIX domain-containing protein, partial [Acidobacteria bacterium]|nr:NUDIX domain-containing protein [Acidobacteriota bacterium]